MADGYWQIVLNEAGGNLIANPSFELGTAAYTAVTGSIAQGAVARRGKYGLTITPTGAGAADVGYSVSTTAGVTYTFSLDIKGTAGIVYRIYFTNASNTLLGTRTFVTATGDWQRVEVTYAETSSASRRLHVGKTDANTDDFYTDGWQCEAKAYATTYIDGDEDGCSWTGTPHASTSTRDGQSRDGGRPYTLSEYGIYVRSEPGAGMPPVQIQETGQGAGDGSYFQGHKIMPRTLVLDLTLYAETRTARHVVRRQLIDLINPRSVGTQQPFIVRYTGNDDKVLQCRFVYGGGGEMNPAPLRHVETPAVMLVAHDPYWYEDGNSSAVLDAVATATFNLVAARLNGRWSDMGPPDAAGTYTVVKAIAVDPNGPNVYFAGDFLNFDNNAFADHIVKWNGDWETDNWDDLGGADDVIHDMAVDANGDLYVTGEFTVIGGVAAVRAAVWNGTVWSALGSGLDGIGYAVCVGTDNKIYFGGAFTADVAAAVTMNKVGAWDKATSAWEALGATPGVNSTVNALATGPEGFIYAGGAFTTAGGAAAVRIAFFTASTPDKAWYPMGSGFDNEVNSIVTRPNGDVYVGGSFTVADGNSISGIARWNGSTFLPLGLGISALPHVLDMAFTSDGLLWVVGWFSEAGDLVDIGRIAAWNGSRWQQADADLPYVSGPHAIESRGSELFVGLDDTGTGTYGTVVTVTNGGSAWAWPVLHFKRTGGDSLELRTIINETTGAKLLLSYNVLDGEELIIDLRPGRRTMYSSFFGTRWKLQPDSDIQDWFLVPGDNDISLYTLEAGGPTVTSHLIWTDTYISAD